MSDEKTMAVARRTELPADVIAQREANKVRNAAIAAIRGQVWSQHFNADTMRAVAQYCAENDLDPVTEVHVLGGNLYIGARYYERKLQALVGADRIEYAKADWVHEDADLEAMATEGDAWAIEERARRRRERIIHNLKKEADAACVFRIKVRGMLEEVTGAKDHIPGRKITIKKKDGGSFQKDADPVGDLSPRETVETRALRRAMLKLANAMPQLALAKTNDDAAVEIDALIAETVPPQIGPTRDVATDYARQEEMPRLTKAVVSEELDLYEDDAA